MISTAQVLSFLAATAAAVPTSYAAGPSKPFTLIATHSGDFSVHLRSINAADGQFFLGRDTKSYCPSSSLPAGACPPGNVTAFAANSEAKTLALDTTVPGGQQVYIHPSGYLAFTQAHSGAVPKDAITTGFDYIPPAAQGSTGTLKTPKDLTACPTGNKGEFQVKAVLEGLSYVDCISMGAVGSEFRGDGAAAWQYD